MLGGAVITSVLLANSRSREIVSCVRRNGTAAAKAVAASEH